MLTLLKRFVGFYLPFEFTKASEMTFVVTIIVHFILSICSFYMFASYYTPGNPVRPNDPYVDAMLIAALVILVIQTLIIIPLGIYARLALKRILYKWLIFSNFFVAAIFASFLIAELFLYCGDFYWC